MECLCLYTQYVLYLQLHSFAKLHSADHLSLSLSFVSVVVVVMVLAEKWLESAGSNVVRQ